MKIVMVVRLVDGGMKKHIDTLLSSLGSLEVVFVGSRELAERYQLKSCQLDISDGLSYRRDIRSIGELARVIKNESPDLVHVHGMKAALIARLALLLRKKPPPLVYTVHNYPIWSVQKGLSKINTILERQLQKRTSAYIAVSYPLATYIARTWKAKDVYVVHNGLEVIYQDYSKAAGELTVGTMVRLVKEKGVDVLLGALALLKNEGLAVRCLVAGMGPEKWHLQRLVEEYGLSDTVSFLGMVEDVEAFMSQLSLFVMPSRSEGLSYAILEAMACGKPIIASDVGGIPDLVEPGITGYLVPPDQPQALAQALKRLIFDRPMMELFGSNSRRRVLTEFTAERMVQQTMEVYSEVLQKDRGIVGK